MRRVVVVLLVIVVAACGIDSSDSIEEITPEELDPLTQVSPTTTITTTTIVVPQTSEPTDTTVKTQVSEPPDTGTVETPESSTTVTPASTTTTTTIVATQDVELYFINGSQLVPVQIALPIPISPVRQLGGLAAGPLADDAEAGIRTAVPAELVAGLEIRGDRVTIDLDGEVLNGVESLDQLHMFGQIVLTLTGQLGFDEVRFMVDGEPARVFLGDNSLSEPGEIVTRHDYEELLEDGPRVSPTALEPAASTQ